MNDRQMRCSRRKFLAQAAALTLATGVPAAAQPTQDQTASGFRARPPIPSRDNRKPIATLTTVYRPMSHSYHIAGRFIRGYPRESRFHVPMHYVRSLYVDQKPDNDLSQEEAKVYDLRQTKSIADALTEGSKKLTVEGVLLIAEHGNYKRNEQGQILYPRYEWMEQIVSVFRQTGQVVPIFCDKHLSYSWEKAKRMYEWAKELKIPFMAGSSLPVTWRRPELELPLESPVEDALVATYGPIEVYGFHALETLQVMVERRRGGETGIKAVTCLTGKQVWKAGDEGRWSWDLLEHALGRSETLNPGDIRRNVGMPVQAYPAIPPTAFLIEYRDGLRGTVLLLNGHIQDFCFAAKVKGESQHASCMFNLPLPPGAKFFDGLVANVEKFLETGRSPYPVERTLLTSGALDAVMESHYRRGERIQTPQLEIQYRAPVDSGFSRGSPANPV